MKKFFQKYPETEITEHEIELDNIIEMLLVWSAPGIRSPTAKLSAYEVKSLRLDGSNEIRECKLPKVRDDPQRVLYIDNHPIATCSTLYVPVQHTDLFARTNEVVEDMFPNAPIPTHYQGGSIYSVLTTYLIRENESIPWDDNHGYDYWVIITNSLDFSYSIQIYGFWVRDDGKVRLQDNIKRFHHARASEDDPDIFRGKAYQKLMENSMGYFKRTISASTIPLNKWQKLATIPVEPKMVVDLANELMLTIPESERLMEWGYKLEREDGKYTNFELISPDYGKNMPEFAWDLIVMLTDIASKTNSIEREWKLTKEIANKVRIIATRY